MKKVELGKILKDKNPKLARLVPGFIIRWLESLICARQINHVLDNYSAQPPIEFIGSTLDYMGVSYMLHHTENIPKRDSRVIFAANHPLGGLDGLMLAHGLAKFIPESEIKLIVNDILMNIEPLRPMFVPINKHGTQNAVYAKAQRELYESNRAIITFPAGLCSRLIHGEITDPEWKRNFIVKAAETSRTIVPTYIKGRNSMLFYRVALLRKRLGIKANLEMILLPREMFAQHGKHVDIYFGQPIEIDDTYNTREWVNVVRDKCYEQERLIDAVARL